MNRRSYRTNSALIIMIYNNPYVNYKKNSNEILIIYWYIIHWDYCMSIHYRFDHVIILFIES